MTDELSPREVTGELTVDQLVQRLNFLHQKWPDLLESAGRGMLLRWAELQAGDLRWEYAIRQVSLDSGETIIHSATENERIVQVWRERKMERQQVVRRKVGEWEVDTG